MNLIQNEYLQHDFSVRHVVVRITTGHLENRITHDPYKDESAHATNYKRRCSYRNHLQTEK